MTWLVPTRRTTPGSLPRLLCLRAALCFGFFWGLATRAQENPVPSTLSVAHTRDTPEAAPPAVVPDDPLTTMFPHSESDRWWLSGQANFISQWHPAFDCPYQGEHSLSPQAQDATSRTLTLFTGLRLAQSTEFLCDVQETGGHGLGQAFGVAGFFNLDVVRNPTLSKAPYVARLMWHQIIPLGGAKIASDR